MKKLTSTLLVLLLTLVANARDITYMVNTYGDDANDGLSWATAKRTIQGAMSVAGYGDNIWVAKGTYYPTDASGANTDASLSFTIKSGVKLYGGFPAVGEPTATDRDPEKNPAVLCGNIGDPASTTDNSVTVFKVTDTTIDDLTVVDGFTIKDAKTNSILISGGGPIMRNITVNKGKVLNNSASTLYFQNSSLTGVVFEHNSAGKLEADNCKLYSGSAMIQKNDSSSIAVRGFTFDNSYFKKECNSANTSIANSTFINCKKIICYSSTSTTGKVSISNCTFKKNTSAILQTEEIATIKNCSFTENTLPLLPTYIGFDHSNSGTLHYFTLKYRPVGIFISNKSSYIEDCSFVNNEISQSDMSGDYRMPIFESGHPIRNWIDTFSSSHSSYYNVYIDFSVFGYTKPICVKGTINRCLFENNKSLNTNISITGDILLGSSKRYSSYYFKNKHNKTIYVDHTPSVIFECGTNNIMSLLDIFEGSIKNSTFVNNCLKPHTVQKIKVIADGGYNTKTATLESYKCNPKSIILTVGGSTIQNCTIVNNSVFVDGDAHSNSASAISTEKSKIQNCTVVGNYTNGGMCVLSTNGTTDDNYKPKNCIIWNNKVAGGAVWEYVDCRPLSSIWGQDYRTTADDKLKKHGWISDFGVSSTKPTPVGPKLLPLGNYGGTVPTMPVDSGSPAIGNGVAISDITTDQRGFTRSSTPTIGACEFQNSIEGANVSTKENESVFAPNKNFTLRANTDTTVLEYIWTKNGEPMQANGDGSLTDSLASGSAKYVATLIYDGGVYETKEFVVSVGAPIIYVSKSGNDSNDGLTWETAKLTIPAALKASVYGSEIWVAKGAYGSITLRNGRTIVGEFNGNETSKSERVLPTHPFDTEKLTTTVESIVNGPETELVTQDASIDGIKVLGNATALYSSFSLYNSYVHGVLKMTRNWSDKHLDIYMTRLNGHEHLFEDISPIKFTKSFRGHMRISNTNVESRILPNYHYEFKDFTGWHCITNRDNPYATFDNVELCSFENYSSNNISGNVISGHTGNLDVSDSINVDLDCSNGKFSSDAKISNSQNISFKNVSFGKGISISGSTNTSFENCTATKADIASSTKTNLTNISLLNSDTNALTISNSSRITLTNAVLYNATGTGITLSGSDNMTLMHCTIYKNKGTGIYTADSTSSAIFNSIIWGNSKSFDIANSIIDSWTVGYSNIQGGYSNGVEIMNVNPRILEVGSFDNVPMYLGLIESSPMRAKAASQDKVVSSIIVPSTDLRGVIRSKPSALGAFEYITPTSVLNRPVDDDEVARGRDTVFSVKANGVYRYYWVHASTNSGWPWSVMNGKNGSSYSRLTETEDKFTSNYYGSWLLDKNGGIKEAGYGSLNVFDLIYVRKGATGNKDGTSWQHAFHDLATAVNAAMTKTRIYVSAGTYAVNDANPTNTDRKQAFTMKNDVEIFGGFSSEGEPEFEDRDVEKYETILTADLLANDADTNYDGAIDDNLVVDNAYRVFFHPASAGLNKSAVLDGFTIQGGYDDATEEEYKSGAGMHNNGSSPTIRNCLFVNNYSVNNGGALFNTNNSKPVIEDCEFLNNYAYYGGAICDTSASPSILRTAFNYNTAKYDGGAIRNNSNSKPTITDCSFEGNSANRGAGIDAYESSPIVKRCSFYKNSATSSGGALYAYTSSNARMENCTMTENTSYFGGAIYARDNSNVQIVNCTISANSAKYNGGALYSQNTTPVVLNSILWNNTASSGGNEIYTNESTPNVSYSIISGGYNGIAILTTDPRLGTFSDNDGYVKTMAITSNSSAIGAGIIDETTPTTDARNFKRSTTVATVGAYEFPSKPVITKNPSSLEMYENEKHELSVSGSGVELEYQWYKDGVAITGATNSTLNISNPNDSGSYYCVVSNPAGSVETNVVVVNVKSHTGVFYVSTTGKGDKSGTSWANAFADVQTAIDIASSVGGGEVWIAKGTYKHGSQMTMKNNVAIYGGFAGTETSKEERVAGNETILDGEGKYRVFYNKYTESNPLTNSAKLDNVTIQNGVECGIWNEYASLEITDCKFYNNNSGAIYNNQKSNSLIKNCIFENNKDSGGSGGAIDNNNSNPIIIGCTFKNNTAKNYGGGIRNLHSNSIIKNCTFENNTATTGGGIWNEYSSPEITNCTFTGNTVSGDGGGVYNHLSSNPTITNCTFNENSANWGGCIYNRDDASPKITNCTFANNHVTASGAGMFNNGYDNKCNAVLINCTFANNSADSTGGAIYSRGGSNPILKNCILWNNTASTDGNEIYLASADCTITIDTCIIKNGKTGIYNSSYCTFITEPITTDPKLQALADNGGNVKTIAVANGSSAIGEGMVVDGVTTDARGATRSTTAPTIGAYEYGASIVIKPTILTQPNGFEVNKNANGSISVSANGTDLSYQWYKDGVAISGATSSTLEFVNIQTNSAGAYYCIISNAIGYVQSETVNVVVNEIAYTLTVENGTGSGSYEADEEITITANEPEDGMVFDKWIGDIENVADVNASTTTIKMPSKNATIIATYVEKPVASTDPFGEPVVYPNVQMTILGEVDFFGSPANEGCVVGAFVGNELRGKTTVVSFNGKAFVNLTLNVSTNGEEITFKIWNPADNSVKNATTDCKVSATSGEVLGSMDSPYQIVFANNIIELPLTLNAGWNQVSFNVGLDSLNIRTILGDVINNVALVQGNGKSFNPSWPDALNTLTAFDNTSGFWIKMNTASSITLTGSALDLASNAITLKAGWNNIGYTPATAGSIRTVLATALADGKIERIINASGNFAPTTPDVLNSLKEMKPGAGYWVKATADTTITFDEPQAQVATFKLMRTMARSASDNFGEPVVYPNVSMTIMADVQIDGKPVPANSVVGVFVGNELRAKSAVIDFEGKTLANLTINVNTDGEALTFKLWNASTGETVDIPNVSVSAKSGDASYSYPNDMLVLNVASSSGSEDDSEITTSENFGEPVVYPNVQMTIMADVQIDGKPVPTNSVVGVFVGNELRAKSAVIDFEGKTLANLTIYVNTDGEALTFKLWNASTGKTVDIPNVSVSAKSGDMSYSYPNDMLVLNIKTAVELTGFAKWADDNKLTGDNAKPTATPYNDGITNLEKFAFGLDASKATSYDANANFKHSTDASGNTTLQFPVSVDAEGVVQVKALKSVDLINWVETTATATGETSSDGKFKIYKATAPVGEDGKVFLKLKVEEK